VVITLRVIMAGHPARSTSTGRRWSTSWAFRTFRAAYPALGKLIGSSPSVSRAGGRLCSACHTVAWSRFLALGLPKIAP
jgi:hypothetical protein